MMSNGVEGFIIAIDGPVASGKGTIAPLLAKKLTGFYMNTGALFRTLGLLCKRSNFQVTEENLLRLLAQNKFDLQDEKVLLNGEDVSKEIYSAEMSQYASQIAVLPVVHAQVISIEQEIGERKMAEGKVVIVEGRNIGTAVFPKAAMKIFLTASVAKRAQRRFSQAIIRKEDISFEQVLEETESRDNRDHARDFFPLVSNPKDHGYFTLDNTDLTEEQTLSLIISELEKRKLL